METGSPSISNLSSKITISPDIIPTKRFGLYPKMTVLTPLLAIGKRRKRPSLDGGERHFSSSTQKKMKTATLGNHVRDSFPEIYSDAREILIAARYIHESSLPLEPTFSSEQALDFKSKLSAKTSRNRAQSRRKTFSPLIRLFSHLTAR
jgi:hypothetical protein